LFRDRTGLVGGPLCGFLRHFAACYTVIQPVIHPCLGLSLKEWKDAGRERIPMPPPRLTELHGVLKGRLGNELVLGAVSPHAGGSAVRRSTQ